MTRTEIKNSVRYKKELCQLYYQQKILDLYQQGKSIREITDYLNKICIPKSKYKDITLSRGTIHKIIKNNKKENNV